MQCKTKEGIEYKITQICYSTILYYHTFQLIIIKLQYGSIFKARISIKMNIQSLCTDRKERILILYYHLQEKEKKFNLMDKSQ
jgi:hypothetical protein